MTEQERTVAGLRCSEVLSALSDYLDGDLPAEDVARVEGHLRGCDWCERFGSDMGHVVAELREQLQEPEPLDPSVSARLLARLRKG